MNRAIGCMILLMLIYSSSLAQSMDCSKFRTGHFIITVQDGLSTKIDRFDSIQKETILDGSNHEDNNQMIYNIRWVDSCTYILIPTEIVLSNHPELPKDALFTVKIIEIKENSYIQETSANFSTFTSSAEVKRVE